MSQPASLLVVGSVAFDCIDGPFGRHDDVLGGSASFFSIAASYFTPQVKLVAVVGDDFPDKHVELFRKHGVDISGLERAKGQTFRWVGRYADDLATRTTLDTQLGVFAGFQPRLTDDHRGAEFVFLGNIDPVLQLQVVEQIKKPKLVACDTMNFWIGGKPAELRRMLKHVDLLVVNDEEARQLAGVHNLVRAARQIRDMGPRAVVVKRGDSGALLFHEAGVFAAPALPIEDVRDPTGAGDTFAGGFMGYLARTNDVSPDSIRRAMIYGSVMASFCVEDFSLDRLQSLTLQDISARVQRFQELGRWEDIAL
jgi:sugar/nucleoside kinase (ribokinase family)